jgi:hypothetical protein
LSLLTLLAVVESTMLFAVEVGVGVVSPLLVSPALPAPPHPVISDTAKNARINLTGNIFI